MLDLEVVVFFWSGPFQFVGGVVPRPWHFVPKAIGAGTFVLQNEGPNPIMLIQTGIFVVDLPIKSGDFPQLC